MKKTVWIILAVVVVGASLLLAPYVEKLIKDPTLLEPEDGGEEITSGLPEHFNLSYCNDNYIYADRNLVPMSVVQGGVGNLFYGIEGVPYEMYLCSAEAYLTYDHDFGVFVLQKKGLSTNPIENWSYKSVELFVAKYNHFPGFKCYDGEQREILFTLGESVVESVVASIDADAFREYLIESINLRNYTAVGGGGRYNGMFVRITFHDYENLVWDAPIYYSQDDHSFYISVYPRKDDGTFAQSSVFMKLPTEIAALIPR